MTPAGPAIRTVTRDELLALLDRGDVALVEALSAAAYQDAHLPGAVNAPGQAADLTADQAATLAPDPAGPVVVYCSGPSCGRSTATARAFARLGYTDVRVYPAGKADWADAGLPLVTSPTRSGR